MSREITLSDADFDKILSESALPVLVDFWAPWCGPCRYIGPIVAQIAEEKAAILSVGKLNVDDNPAVSQRYGITGIPTLILFKGGRPVERIVGALSKEALEQQLAKHL
ncbi:MAG: thioredoxin [Calditrichaeota bacterium]|nr:thioredoxin [Calditrichota bacterium]